MKTMSFSFDCVFLDFKMDIPNLYLRIFWQIAIIFSQILLSLIVLAILKVYYKSKLQAKSFIW